MIRGRILGLFAIALVTAACHASFEKGDLAKQKIYFTDRFFDVKAMGPGHALVVGYRGKVIETTDACFSFTDIPSGTPNAIYDLAVHGQKVWAAGQDGMILHSSDGGKTWAHQKSGVEHYLFSIFFLDENRGWAVGDRSAFVKTTDGGKTWVKASAVSGNEDLDPNMALAMQDPVLYDVNFVDENVGWLVGEFGRILRTEDGGASWLEQQEVLVGPHTGIVDPFDLPTFFSIFPVSGQEAYVAGLEGKIGYTSDAGANWGFAKMDLAFPMSDPLYTTYIAADGSGWGSGAAGEVIRKEAGSDSWKRADLGMSIYTWIRAIDFLDEKEGWMVGGYGTILHTDDGGKSWGLCLG